LAQSSPVFEAVAPVGAVEAPGVVAQLKHMLPEQACD